MDGKELVTIDYSDMKLLKTLRDTLCKELTAEEFAIVLEFAKTTRLNPFKKEFWPIKAGGRLQLMTGLNGYLAIANSHPQFDGMEVEIDDNITKATCKVYRKDRKYPSVGIALMREFKKNTPIWGSMPSVMLTKCAKSIALREAFSQELGGTYTEEEMPAQFTRAETVEVTGFKAADESPPLKNQFWVYDFALLPENKRDSGRDWAMKNGCYLDETTGLFVSEKRLPNLDKYQVQGIAKIVDGKLEIIKPKEAPAQVMSTPDFA